MNHHSQGILKLIVNHENHKEWDDILKVLKEKTANQKFYNHPYGH